MPFFYSNVVGDNNNN